MMRNPSIPLNGMIRTALVLALTLHLSAVAAQADGLSAERVRGLVESGAILPLEEILKRNETSISGRVIEIEIEQKHGIYLYEIKVLRPDGHYREIKINARTGARVGAE